MKERPILFSAPMVRALLDGSKTQTRRVIKDQRIGETFLDMREGGAYCEWEGTPCCGTGVWEVPLYSGTFPCPHGVAGDRLWVRESFWGCDLPGYGDQPCVVYDDEWVGKEYHPAEPRPWGRKFGRIPSIHMPRDCSRVLLEIVSVRVERLNDCSDADARAEGCPCYVCARPLDGSGEDDCHCFHRTATSSDYRNLWESINGAGSWAANPWVWVVEFKRVAP